MTEVSPDITIDLREVLKKRSITCPVCSTLGKVFLKLIDMNGHKIPWIICNCGCVYNTQPAIDLSGFYTEAYKEKMAKKKRIALHYDYVRRVYLPVIEEMTYGRRFLDVAFGLPLHIEELRKRGWLSEGIDIIPNNYMTGNFEDYDFGNKTYDFIMMGQILQCFRNPVLALQKAYNLLNPDGCLLVMTPDTELIYLTGYVNWGHWNGAENRSYWSEHKLRQVAERIGFRVTYSRKNFSPRFIAWNDMHVILQKPIINDKWASLTEREQENGKINSIGDIERDTGECRGSASINDDSVVRDKPISV